jgi:hypothetical protein
VADVIHLLAELVENATAFSPPDTKVVLRAHPVAAGLAVEIDDRGLGMHQQEYDRLNTLLREPSDISVRELLEGARIGLYVVAQLAQRHGIAIQLQTNITGGTQALVVLPKSLLATTEPRVLDQSRRERAAEAASSSPASSNPMLSNPAQSNPAPLNNVSSNAVSPNAMASNTASSSTVSSNTVSLNAAMPAAGRADTAAQAPFEALRGERPAYGLDGALPAPRRPAAPGFPGSPPAQGARQTPPPVPPPLSEPAHPAAPDSGTRPPLPRRRPPEHLAAPLLEAAPDPAGRVGEEPSPTLLADFRRGLARGSAAPGPGPGAAPTDHVFTQEGER